jgi:uncharacterized DUF497 family protein
MRFSWDMQKDSILRKNLSRGGLGFQEVLSVFTSQHYVTLRNDDPEQFVAIGWVNLTLYSIVFECRHDELGEYYHLVTFWKSTTTERNLYAKNSK